MSIDNNPESVALPNETPSGFKPPEFSRRRLVAGLLLLSGLAIGGIALAMAGRGGLEAFRTATPRTPYARHPYPLANRANAHARQ